MPTEPVVASPRFHRWHNTGKAEGRDKNFAGLLPLWDIMFGTHQMPTRNPVRLGSTIGFRVPSSYGRSGGGMVDRHDRRLFHALIGRRMVSLEARVEALEKEVAFLREKSREHDQKLDDILGVVVGLHTDLAALERKVDRGFERIDRRFEQMDKRFDELPSMIAQVVGEVMRAQGRS